MTYETLSLQPSPPITSTDHLSILVSIDCYYCHFILNIIVYNTIHTFNIIVVLSSIEIKSLYQMLHCTYSLGQPKALILFTVLEHN